MNQESLFRSGVLSSLAMLIHKHNFQAVSIHQGYVQLDSENVRISITYDFTRSYEVDLCFQMRKSDAHLVQESYSLKEVYQLYRVPDGENGCFFQSTDLNKVIDYLNFTSQLLVKYCRPVLQGNKDAFAQLETLQKKAAAQYTFEAEAHSVHTQAEEAWHNKNMKNT